jgi:Zn-dependent alcohol dehydrogenase
VSEIENVISHEHAFGIVNVHPELENGIERELTLEHAFELANIQDSALTPEHALQLANAKEIIAFDNRKNANIKVKRFGGNLLSKLNAKKYSNYFDKVFISSTESKNIEYAHSILGYGGELYVVGVPSPKDIIKIKSLDIHFNKKLRGSYGGSINPQRDIQTYINLQKEKKINLKHLIIKEYQLKDINIPIMKMLNKKSPIGRYLIRM